MTSNPRFGVSAAAFLLAACGGLASADIFKEKDAKCGDNLLGRMRLNATAYKPVDGNTGGTDTQWLGGVNIEGEFVRNNTLLTYHYVQVITGINWKTTQARWLTDKSVELPVPFCDTPPAGYAFKKKFDSAGYDDNQAFDSKVYYDEGEFPKFEDAPKLFMLHAKDVGGTFTVDFETWLIAVCDEKINGGRVQKDTYKVAPLVGWTWGFEIKFKDDGNGKNDLTDFTTSALAMDFAAAPSAAWKKGISKDTVYGAGDNKDWWDVGLGECKDTKVPAPASLAPGLLGAACIGRRRRAA